MQERCCNIARLLAACGAVAGLAQLSQAQPTVISIAGATLLENLLNQRAGSVDYIDADGDLKARSFPYSSGNPNLNDQLAPFELPSAATDTAAGWSADTFWGVSYGAIGSTNGLQELINTGRSFSTLGGAASGNLMPISRRTVAYFNRYKYIIAGATNDDNSTEFPLSYTFIMNAENPGGLPVRQNTNTGGALAFKALYTAAGTASTQPNAGLTQNGGLRVDIAPLDVPVSYAVTQSGTAGLELNPTGTGYGNNTRLAKNKDGTDTTTNASFTSGGGNKLASLVPTGGPDPAANINEASPDANTIFSTPLVFAPVCVVSNYGTGLTQLDMSDVRHLFSTGRRESGENLIAVTRDSGSGTRNAFNNSTGIDPSWGIGDNLGARNNGGPITNLADPNVNGVDRPGADFLANNKQGNNRVEPSVAGARLAVGYVGPERGVVGGGGAGWLENGQLEILGVRNNIAPYTTMGGYTGAVWARPTIDAILNNDVGDAYVIGGPGSVATFGKPSSAPAVNGGLGWMEPYADGTNGQPLDGAYQVGEDFNDRNNNTVRDACEPRPGVLPPAMQNVQAAAFVNNFTRSTDAFVELPGSDETIFTPGELAATRFILIAAQKRSQNPLDPIDLDPNPSYTASLQDFVDDPGINVQSRFEFETYGNSVDPLIPANSRAGKVPNRLRVAGVYSDQALVPAGDKYITEGGTLLDTTFSTGTFLPTTNLPLRNLVSGDFNGDGLRNLNDATNLVLAYRKRHAGGSWTAPSGSGALLALADSIASYPGAPVVGSGASRVVGTDACIEILGDFNNDGSHTLADLRYWADGLAIDPGTGKLDRKKGFEALDNANLAAGGTNNVFGTVLKTGKAYSAGDSRADVIGTDLTRVTRGSSPIGANGIIDENDIAYIHRQFHNLSVPAPHPVVPANWANLVEAVGFDLSADVTGDLIVNEADVTETLKTILNSCYGNLNMDAAVTIAERAMVIVNIGTLPATWARGDMDGDGDIDAADRAKTCPADVNCTGSVTVQDLFDFLNLWFAKVAKADINAAGIAAGGASVTVQDLFDYLAIWFAGNCT